MFTLARTAKYWKKLFHNDVLKEAHSPTTLRVGDSFKVGVHYPAALRAWDSSSNKFQRAALLKFGTHYVKYKKYSEAQ